MNVSIPFILEIYPKKPTLKAGIGPEEILQRLDGLGYSILLLNGWVFNNYRLCVENDAEFIFDAYLDLEMRLENDRNSCGEHHVCLDDARIQMDCYWAAHQASLTTKLFDSRWEKILTNGKIEVSIMQYIGAWRRMIAIMLSYANGEPA